MAVKRIDSGRGHRYTIDGVRAEGVTTVLGMLHKDLARWGAGIVAEFVADNADMVAMMARKSRASTVDYLRKLPQEARQAAATRGTQIHKYADPISRGEEVEVPDEYVPYVQSYLDFLNTYRPSISHAEIGVASRENGHGGTADTIMEFPADLRLIDGSPHPLASLRALADTKTGKGLWEEMALQLSAYRFSDTAVVEGAERDMPEIDVAILIHVGPDGYEVVPVVAGRLQYEAFVALHRAYRKLREAGMSINGNGLKGTPDLILEPYPTPWEEE